jgi:hypothetical protein
MFYAFVSFLRFIIHTLLPLTLQYLLLFVCLYRPIVPAPGDYDDGEIGGMMIGRGNRSPRRKPAPVPLCPPQTSHAAQTRTRAATVGSQQLTA